MAKEKSLKNYIVLQSLTVKDIKVAPDRVSATYEIIDKKGKISSNQHIFKYEKSYFDPYDLWDQNLAAMMVSQVAMNYGLFCEQLIFYGNYDKSDQQFIKEMTENTCREIYVHKLLSHNVFILPEYKLNKVEKQKKYTQAELVFVNQDSKSSRILHKNAQPDYSHYAILSSGGKDSLLTYGIIQELGIPHPVFINESGRHWFTAINTYRALQGNEDNLAKPWTNSDRIFNWVLRHLPFIRADFSQVRADIYPVRLWTVAVFLFGVLPVAIKRNIGNILIGNEYDTTIKGNYHGITHYHGLYDQSKYFDLALTRYYKRKRWNIYQFSILRSMSELLILKMLVKRYPDLQQHQISCHAAHSNGGRMFPCGKCEKCRRIIGMLMALDEDPRRCGFSSDQIKYGLQDLESHKVKQLGSDAAHLYYLLLKKGWIESNDFTKRLANNHPEIEMMRFDRERSNPEDLPQHIRHSLYPLLLSYSKGAVALISKKWKKVDITKQLPEFN